MIQLNDIKQTVINPSHIVFFNVDDSLLEKEYDGFHDQFTGKLKPKSSRNIKGDEVTVVGEIKCMLNYYGFDAWKYDCKDALHADYQKLLIATNA